MGKSISSIAEHIGKSKSTVSREIKRNRDERSGVYKAALADKKARERHKQKPKHKHLSTEVERELLYYLNDKWSPQQIYNRTKSNGCKMVSHETIYQYIWNDRRHKGKLYLHLRTQGKRYRKRGHMKDNRGLLADRIDISQRPPEVDKKERFGDLEVDLVMGKNHQGALLTINDRATGYLWMDKIENKEASTVEQKIIELLQDIKPYIKTITSDNGKEFANHKKIQQSLGINYYFAKPYQSWQRGANENLNGLVRQYYPKKTNFEHITTEQIHQTTYALNHRPRKRFGYKTPSEIYTEKLKSLDPVAFIT